MNPATRQKVLLGLLALILAFAGIRWLTGGDGGGSSSSGAAANAGAASEDRGRRGRGDRPVRATVTESRELRLADLDGLGGTYRPGRNPFDFYVPPPPPRVEQPRVVEREVPIQAPPVVTQPVETGPRPPAIDFSYIGRFGPRSRPIAVLSNGEQIINARIGDVVDGKFKLVDIGLESIRLQYVEFPELPARTLRVGAEGT